MPKWLFSTTPPQVVLIMVGPLVARADAVHPMVFVGETAARPAQHRHLDLLQRGDDVVADAARVGNGAVLAHPDAFIDAPAEVLGEMAVNVPADGVCALVGVNDQCVRGGDRRGGIIRPGLAKFPGSRRQRKMARLNGFTFMAPVQRKPRAQRKHSLKCLSPFAFTCLSCGLLIEGQAGCQSRERSPHSRLVVSNLQPAPRQVPRSRIWFQTRRETGARWAGCPKKFPSFPRLTRKIIGGNMPA